MSEGQWPIVALGELIESIEAGSSFRCRETPPEEGEVGVAKVSAVSWGRYDEQESKTCLDPSRINEDLLISKGDFLISRANTVELVGACVIAEQVRKQVMLSDKTLRIVFKDPSLKPWVLHFLRSRAGRQQIEALCTGNQESMRNISQRSLRMIKLPLAPPKERQEILSFIDQQISRADATTTTLQALQTKLKQARASILKAAVEGRLVETEPGPTPQSDEHTQLPSGWVWSTLGAQFSIHIGATPKRNDPSLWGGEIPWVSSGEIQFNRITKTKETITQPGLDNTSTQLHPKGTVLLAMIGQGRTRGQAAILEIEACTNQNCAAIRMNDSGCNSKYVYWWLYYRYDQTRQLGGGNNQQALNKKRVSEIFISLPLPEEQNRIVEAIERRFSILDQVEATVNASLRRCGQLRQAVLKRALERCRSR